MSILYWIGYHGRRKKNMNFSCIWILHYEYMSQHFVFVFTDLVHVGQNQMSVFLSQLLMYIFIVWVYEPTFNVYFYTTVVWVYEPAFNVYFYSLSLWANIWCLLTVYHWCWSSSIRTYYPMWQPKTGQITRSVGFQTTVYTGTLP